MQICREGDPRECTWSVLIGPRDVRPIVRSAADSPLALTTLLSPSLSPLSPIYCPVDLSVQASRAPHPKYLPSIPIPRMFIDSASASCGDVALPRCKPAYIPWTNRFRVHERGSRVVSTTSGAL